MVVEIARISELHKRCPFYSLLIVVREKFRWVAMGEKLARYRERLPRKVVLDSDTYSRKERVARKIETVMVIIGAIGNDGGEDNVGKTGRGTEG